MRISSVVSSYTIRAVDVEAIGDGAGEGGEGPGSDRRGDEEEGRRGSVLGEVRYKSQ